MLIHTIGHWLPDVVRDELLQMTLVGDGTARASGMDGHLRYGTPGTIIIEKAGDRYAGWLYAIHRSDGEAMLGVYVRPEYRGKGVATRLVDKVVEMYRGSDRLLRFQRRHGTTVYDRIPIEMRVEGLR